jgi:hypothetical protein
MCSAEAQTEFLNVEMKFVLDKVRIVAWFDPSLQN